MLNEGPKEGAQKWCLREGQTGQKLGKSHVEPSRENCRKQGKTVERGKLAGLGPEPDTTMVGIRSQKDV